MDRFTLVDIDWLSSPPEPPPLPKRLLTWDEVEDTLEAGQYVVAYDHATDTHPVIWRLGRGSTRYEKRFWNQSPYWSPHRVPNFAFRGVASQMLPQGRWYAVVNLDATPPHLSGLVRRYATTGK